MVLGPPATRTECYLAAILDELRVLRAAVGDGRPGPQPVGQAVPVDGRAEIAGSKPTKRTRTRPARAS